MIRYHQSLQIFLLITLTEFSSPLSQVFPGPARPFFSSIREEKVYTEINSTAYLSCEVYNRNNLSVSWVRLKDSHIISVNTETFISDRRFFVVEKKEKMFDRINLVIQKVMKKDEGLYECQVSFQPKISKILHLVVLKPKVSILGDPDIYVKEGSELVIQCTVKNTARHVPFVTWLYKGQVSPDNKTSQLYQGN